MEKKLPHNLNSKVKSECWTFFRTFIIDSYEEYRTWYAHHLDNIFITSDYACDFGEFGKRYNLITHYDDVFKFKEITFASMLAKEAIDFLCDNIDNNVYTVIDLDISKIIESVPNQKSVQYMIYGYDADKKVFFYPSIRSGFWHEEEMPYGKFIDSFNSRKAFSKEQVADISKRQNPFPIITITPKKDYHSSISLSKFLNNIRNTVNAPVYKEKDGSEFREGILGVYEGLTELCCNILKQRFKPENFIYDHDFISGFSKTLEYNKLFLDRIQIIKDYLKLDINEEIISNAIKLIEYSEITKNLALRYKSDNKNEYLEKMIRNIKILSELHKRCLCDILVVIRYLFYDL